MDETIRTQALWGRSSLTASIQLRGCEVLNLKATHGSPMRHVHRYLCISDLPIAINFAASEEQ